MNRLCTLSIIVVMLLTISPVAWAMSAPQYSARMFSSKPFIEERTSFYPEETMYLVINLENVPAGEHLVSVEWIQPNGELVRTSSKQFTLGTTANFRVYFWLQLGEKGPMAQLFSGGEYNQAVYGDWRIRVSFNAAHLTEVRFNITDRLL